MKRENNHNVDVDRKLSSEDGLKPLDLSQVHSIDDLIRAMARTPFTGRQLGEAADVLEAMARDEECFVVMTLSGVMTEAKQGLVISELIERGIVNAIVSTGALIAHGSVDTSRPTHLRGILDEPEPVLDDVRDVMSQILVSWDHNDVVCSYKLNHAIGANLAKRDMDRNGILRSAYEKGVPVFIPDFADSELGLDVALSNRLRESTGRHKLRFDPFEDLEHFAATLLRQNRLGIFTIGGGVAGNWAQQFGPFIALRHHRMGENVPLKRYHYGVRISPESAYWGGLSGNLDGKANSSEKFVPSTEGGRFGEVFVDATVGLPLIVAAVLERLGPHKPSVVEVGKTKARKPAGKKRV